MANGGVGVAAGFQGRAGTLKVGEVGGELGKQALLANSPRASRFIWQSRNSFLCTF
jgi:hypothetical protein